MLAVTVGWQIYDLTNDPLSLGLIGLAEVIPSIGISLFAGHLVDKYRRKTIVVFAYTLLLFCYLSLFLISYNLKTLSFSTSLILIYSVIFLSGIARGFIFPSTFALLSEIVPREKLSNAISWSTSFWQMGAVIGPLLAGFSYGYLGPSKTYINITAFCLIAIILILQIKIKKLSESTSQETLFERLTSGVKFVFREKILMTVMSLDMFAVLFGGVVAILPVYAKDILNTGPDGLGWLRASPSFGAIIIALILTQKSPVKFAGRNLLISVAGFGISILVFAVSRNFLLSMLALALSGMFDSISVIIRQTIFQVMTPENMKGRVSAVNSIFIGSSNEIGAFESGAAAKLLGTVPSVIFGGTMTLLIVIITYFISPKLKKLSL